MCLEVSTTAANSSFVIQRDAPSGSYLLWPLVAQSAKLMINEMAMVRGILLGADSSIRPSNARDKSSDMSYLFWLLAAPSTKQITNARAVTWPKDAVQKEVTLLK